MASSAFARHYLRNHGCFLFLWVLRCFTSPRSLLLPYVFRQRSPDITPVSFEVSLFGDPRIEARLPAPRGLSQVTTSFVGSWCQGIHRLPLVACCYYKDARVHCEVLNIRAVTRTQRQAATGSGPQKIDCQRNRNFRTQQRAWALSRVSSTFHSCYAGCTDDETDDAAYWSMFHIPELSSREHSSRIWALDEQSSSPCSLERR